MTPEVEWKKVSAELLILSLVEARPRHGYEISKLIEQRSGVRRMKAKLGPQAATMATAHKIAVIFYTMIKNQVEYDETIWNARDAEREKRLQAKLKRQAKQLGYELVPIEPQAA